MYCFKMAEIFVLPRRLFLACGNTTTTNNHADFLFFLAAN